MKIADPAEFLPPLLRISERPAAPLAGWVLRLLVVLGVFAIGWAMLARLDIVAVADGKLVPSMYLKIVQPAEQGIVREILVREGQVVAAGQVLVRMDPALNAADVRALQADVANRRLALRRVDAQLGGKPLVREPSDPPEQYARVESQLAANVRAYENALAQERALLDKARHDLAGAEATRAKLEQVLPHYRDQEKAFDKLAREGFAGRILYTDKQRERIEKEEDLLAQHSTIRSSSALIDQSERKIAQIAADYRRQLQSERVDAAAQLERAEQELAKHAHRHGLHELRAPQAGVVKDLATHTEGTVTSPGTILMTLVPHDDRLVAEVWIANDDVGFVRAGQPVKVKVASFPFQKYGLLDGRVLRVNADATEAAATRADAAGRNRAVGSLFFRALVELDSQSLAGAAGRFSLQSGMQVAAEIHLGTRSVMEYLLSPVQKVLHEAGRER